jgi:DNA-binding MarR family transcriptional regulator
MNDYKNDLNIDEKVMMASVRLAESFKKGSGAIFQKHGLTFPQYNALRVLDASGRGQSTISNVCDVMLVSGANMTGIVKRLEKAGFLTRQKDPSDDRVTILAITRKGRQTLENIVVERDRHIREKLKGFTKREKEEFVAQIVRILKRYA